MKSDLANASRAVRPATKGEVAGISASSTSSAPSKPSHYKVICISMYTDDLKRLDGMVTSLKDRGLTKASRSALIRHALSLVDLEKVPKGL